MNFSIYSVKHFVILRYGFWKLFFPPPNVAHTCLLLNAAIVKCCCQTKLKLICVRLKNFQLYLFMIKLFRQWKLPYKLELDKFSLRSVNDRYLIHMSLIMYIFVLFCSKLATGIKLLQKLDSVFKSRSWTL